MQAEKIASDEKRQGIARSLGFLTAGELAILAGVKTSTLEAWRKRKQGPKHIQFGNEPLYPMCEVKRFLDGLYLTESSAYNPRRHISDAL